MEAVVLIAFAAAIGNLLQGWDNATIAGAVIYIKKEFHLEKDPTIEGLIVAMSLIGATFITTFSGPVSDTVGRRPMMILSSFLYFVSGLIMLWAPNVYVLLLARLLDGFGIGLAVTLVPIYISETAPSEIRGLLNTFPQFCGSSGMFMAYCMVFGMSLGKSPSWRLMLGFLSVVSTSYVVLTIFFLPESPRWLVSKGRMREAKKVLQRLRGKEDVSGELALLVEGLGVGKETSIEEYIVGPDNDLGDQTDNSKKDQIRLYGPEEGLSWVAKPVTGQSSLVISSRHGSVLNRGPSLVDPLVTLFGSVHEKYPTDTAGTTRSMIFPNMGSILGLMGQGGKQEPWDVENHRDENDAGLDSDENLHSPLLSREGTDIDKDGGSPHAPAATGMVRRHSSLIQGEAGESIGIGGGWQLAWKWSENKGNDGEKTGGLQRIYLHQEGAASRGGSLVSFHGAEVREQGEYVQASALVSQAALCSMNRIGDQPAGPVRALPPQSATNKGPSWRDLLEPGVKRALVVGVGLQILQQMAGINGVLYYTPQILGEAGVSVLFADMGISSDSASLLISLLTTLLMLPCILVSMRLMDVSGRRALMLGTIPVLIVSLIALVSSTLVDLGSTMKATISTCSVVVYLACFVMGFGAIPNILCSEIFPTNVRGLCITICSLTFWFGNIAVTYSLPLLLKSLGLAGVFSIYAAACIIAWFFIYLKVPETKGMPLEVISEFFAVGA